MKKIICFLLVMQNVFLLAQTKTVVTQYGEKVTIHPNANNGLTPNNGNIQLGGVLTEPATVITASPTNTLAIQGLQTGLITDNIVLTDPTGVVKTISPDTFWQTKGNIGTTAGTNFLGTTDNIDLVFKRNNILAGKLTTTNTAFGMNSLANSSSESNSTAIGVENLMNNTTGKFNVAIGNGNLSANTTGRNNIGVGYQTLLNNTTGVSNLALGNQALLNNVTGGSNIAMGAYALQSNVYGNNNIALGAQALLQHTGGINNLGLGNFSMNLLTSGNYNTAIGQESFPLLTTGSNNIAIGYSSAKLGTVGNLLSADNSIFIGGSTRAQGDGQTNQVVIGYNALGKGSNTVQIGNSSMTSIGGQVAWSVPSDVRLKKDINNSSFGLNFINKLRPVTYHMKTGTADLQTGFIAQEVEKVANSLNYEFSGIVKPQTASDTDYYSLRYSDFVVPLVKAVQEQQEQIFNLEARLQQMEKLIEELAMKK